ncbi:hypothetical protein FQR65_LT12659 [Abscondita terminalis]|nr:hypothetical protein FQR65_LT12659 [Abscondita terminalis]
MIGTEKHTTLGRVLTAVARIGDTVPTIVCANKATNVERFQRHRQQNGALPAKVRPGAFNARHLNYCTNVRRSMYSNCPQDHTANYKKCPAHPRRRINGNANQSTPQAHKIPLPQCWSNRTTLSQRPLPPPTLPKLRRNYFIEAIGGNPSHDRVPPAALLQNPLTDTRSKRKPNSFHIAICNSN